MCDEDIFSQIDTKKMVEINMAETGSPEAPKEKKKRGRKPKAAAAAPPAPLAEEDFYVFQDDKAKKALAALEPKIAEWRGEAERTVVSSPESKEAALSFLLPLDKAAKDIEKARKALVEQPNSYVSRINFFAKCLKEKIGAAAGILNDKILAYDRDERLEREKRRKEA